MNIPPLFSISGPGSRCLDKDLYTNDLGECSQEKQVREWEKEETKAKSNFRCYPSLSMIP